MEKRFQLDRPGYCKIPIDVLTNTKTFPCICAFVVDDNVYCLDLCLEIIYSSRENSFKHGISIKRGVVSLYVIFIAQTAARRPIVLLGFFFKYS